MTKKSIFPLLTVMMFASLFLNLRGLRCGLPSAEQTALVVDSQNILNDITPALKETRDKIYAEYEKTTGSYLEKSVIVSKELMPIVIDGKQTMVDVRKIHSIRSALLQSRFPDEQKMITSLLNINPAKRQFNPHFFQYGGVFVYSAGLTIKISQMLGLTYITPDITYYFNHAKDIQNFFAAPKALCGIVEVFAIPLMFFLGRALFGTSAGFFAALFLAAIPAVPVEAHSLKPFALFLPFMITALVFAQKIYDKRKTSDYFLAGIFTGLSAGTLIFSGCAGISVLCAHWLSFKNGEKIKEKLLDQNIVYLAAGLLIAFFATNPYWLGAFHEVRADFAFLGKAVPFHFSLANMIYNLTKELPKAFGLPVYLMGVCGLILAAVKLDNEDKMLLCAFVPAYLYLVSTLWYSFHYSMPLVPLFLIFAGRFAAFLVKTVKSRALSYSFLAAVVVYTFGYSFFYSNIITSFDGFMQGTGRWINRNIPRGSSINTAFFPGFTTRGYPPFSILEYRINEKDISDYIITVKYESNEITDYSVPKSYMMIKRMEMDKGVLGKIYKREALPYLDPEISVYRLINR